MAGIPVQDELTPMGNYYLIRAKNVDVEGIRLDKVINQVKSSIEAIKTDFYTKEQSDAKYASKTDLNAKEDDIKHFKTWAEYEAAKATIPAGAMFVVDEDNPENQIPKHNLLEGRDEANAHPYTAIEGLQAQLDKKTDVTKTQTLESRMNQFTQLPSGSTAGDAELADIRVGADGKTYENAGEAVRGQVTSLKETIADVARLADATYDPVYIADEYIDKNDGHFVPYANWKRTELIAVDPTKIVYVKLMNMSSGTNYCAYYDSDRNFISSFGLNEGEKEIAIISGAKYIAISIKSDADVALYHKTVTVSEKKIKTIAEKDNIVFDFAQGGLRNGEEIDSGTRIRTDFIPVKYAGIYTFNAAEGYMYYYEEYGRHKNFLETHSYSQGLNSFKMSISTFYIRIVMIKGSGSDFINVDEAINARLTMSISNVSGIDRLRVCSFNLGHFGYGTSNGMNDDLVDEKLLNWKKFFGKQKFDVLCCQEWYTYIDKSKTLNSNEVLFNPLYRDTVHGNDYTQVYSQYPMLDYVMNQYLGTDTTKRRAYIMFDVNINSKIVTFVDVHLYPPETEEGRAYRAEQISQLLAIIADKKYVVICGDFNAATKSEFDAFVAAGYKLGNGQYFGWERTWRYGQDYDAPVDESKDRYPDNIIVSDNITIENFEVINAYNQLTTDHLCVAADLIIK